MIMTGFPYIILLSYFYMVQDHYLDMPIRGTAQLCATQTAEVLKLENEKEVSLGHRMKKDPNVWSEPPVLCTASVHSICTRHVGVFWRTTVGHTL